MPLEPIFKLIASDMVKVDAIIRQSLNSEIALIRQITEYIVNAGGKRLRPTLLLLVAGAFGYRGTCHHKLAAVVELIHTATLLHDDVVDESSLRRGHKTANAEFGNAASVLVGDFLYSQGFRLVIEVDERYLMEVMRVLSRASIIIAEGEVMQLMNCHNTALDEEDYLKVIASKTAQLFEAAARVGAIISDADSEREARMADYGMHLGIAFQLIDDMLDYSGLEAETGKHLGDDLAEGKLTLPLIYALCTGTTQQKECVHTAIERGGLGDFANVLAVINDTKALEYTRSRAQREIQKAKEAINVLPDSVYKDALLELASFAVARSS